ncbi:hypothetical protein D3C72_1732720 [compost metagenome]
MRQVCNVAVIVDAFIHITPELGAQHGLVAGVEHVDAQPRRPDCVDLLHQQIAPVGHTLCGAREGEGDQQPQQCKYRTFNDGGARAAFFIGSAAQPSPDLHGRQQQHEEYQGNAHKNEGIVHSITLGLAMTGERN